MGRFSKIETQVPVRVPLPSNPLGIWGSLKAGRRNVLELIPELATHAPILSGTTGKRWHMVMDPDALHRILREKVNDYPKSMVTKLILEPAIWVPPPGCRVRVPRPGAASGCRVRGGCFPGPP